MQKKRSSWLYLTLGLMLIALIGFSGLPLFISIFSENQITTQPYSATISQVSPEQQAKLDAEARGYQKVLEREPDNNTALKGLLAIRLQQQDVEGAIKPLEKLAKLNSEQTEYTILLAQAKQQIEDFEGAATAYRSILVGHPDNIQALSGITSLFLEQNLPERAISLLKDSSERARQDKAETSYINSVRLLLGEVYAEQERYFEAISVYEQAALADERDFRPVLAKALILHEQGHNQEAKPLLESAYSLAPAQFKDRINQLNKDWERESS
ncbi:MAG: cellulose synthase subunit BcsC [Xenococcaceae cyanobacterium MO_188.B32]|nr:cellulose synthase subunit BcsC [Xenococcaceae cyanobacterium MO_188.B32]